MQEITAYQTKDGKIFSTIEEAVNYEETLKWGKEIEEFTKSTFCPYTGMQLSMVRKTIIAWERYKLAE
jgi:hypothetical protein